LAAVVKADILKLPGNNIGPSRAQERQQHRNGQKSQFHNSIAPKKRYLAFPPRLSQSLPTKDSGLTLGSVLTLRRHNIFRLWTARLRLLMLGWLIRVSPVAPLLERQLVLAALRSAASG
jgi:hypothetical protein